MSGVLAMVATAASSVYLARSRSSMLMPFVAMIGLVMIGALALASFGVHDLYVKGSGGRYTLRCTMVS